MLNLRMLPSCIYRPRVLPSSNSPAWLFEFFCKRAGQSSKFVVIAALPRCKAGRSPRKDFMLLSGILPDFLVDHMMVSLVVHWLFVPTQNAEKDHDDDEEQASSCSQDGDYLWKCEKECKHGAKLFILLNVLHVLVWRAHVYLSLLEGADTLCPCRLRWRAL